MFNTKSQKSNLTGTFDLVTDYKVTNLTGKMFKNFILYIDDEQLISFFFPNLIGLLSIELFTAPRKIIILHYSNRIKALK